MLSIYLSIYHTAVEEHPLGADEVRAQLGHLVRGRGKSRGKGKVRMRLERSLATWLGPCSRSVGSREIRNEWPPLTWLGFGLGSGTVNSSWDRVGVSGYDRVGVMVRARVRVRRNMRREWPPLTTPLRRRAASRKTSPRSSGFLVGPSLCSGRG